jgi:CDP-glycerol glycerophosphotransferase
LSRIKDVLKPVYHSILDTAERAKDTYGKRLSRRSMVDYRKVVLSCNFGSGYLCNPKYIAEALERLYPGEFDIVLLVQEEDPSLPSHLRQVRYGSREAQCELATARFWIYNFRNDKKHVPKREDQIYIQTWHGAIGPKRIERDVEEALSQDYLRSAEYDGSITDIMFANNNLYERIFRSSFWYDGPVIRCGMPRNRDLVLGNPDAIAKVHRALGVSGSEAICLYAPTFRADGSMDAYRFDYARLLAALERRFGRKFVFAYRLHPNIASRPRPDFFRGYVDASFYPDSQELLAGCDVCITDYSSIIEDFMLTGRPGFVYAPDIEAYENDRGFYYPLSSRPFPFSMDEDDLVASVLSYSEEGQTRRVKEFEDSVGLLDDGHGDEVIAGLIHELIEPGSTVAGTISN